MSTPSTVVSTHHIATNTLFTVIPAQAGIQGENHTMDKQFCVYMLASKRNGTLYVGVTSNLPQRVWQHKNKQVEGFTKRYEVDKLVYYEVHRNAESAMTREKRIKKWRRAWKIRLIEETNPEWEDLYNGIAG
jgi:putative endonuclease